MTLLPDLFSFAYVPNWYIQLDELAALALPEPWRFRNSAYSTKNPDNPILERYWLKRRTRQMFRVKGVSWWEQEMPSEDEYVEAFRNLERVGYEADYIITHCAPTSVQQKLNPDFTSDPLTNFWERVKGKTDYHYWLFGHYHDNRAVDEKHILLWEQMVQVI